MEAESSSIADSFFAGVIGPRRPASRATLLSGDKPLLPMDAENQQECERHHDRRQQIQRGEIVEPGDPAGQRPGQPQRQIKKRRVGAEGGSLILLFHLFYRLNP